MTRVTKHRRRGRGRARDNADKALALRLERGRRSLDLRSVGRVGQRFAIFGNTICIGYYGRPNRGNPAVVERDCAVAPCLTDQNDDAVYCVRGRRKWRDQP